MEHDWPANLFARIAVPRLPGTPALPDVTTRIAGQLERWGFQVERQPFTTSSRRLTAASLGAAGLGWVALLLLPLLVLPVSGWIVAVVASGLLGLVAIVTHGVAEGYVPVGLPAIRAENLVAIRGRAPRWWLVAHLDSKSQRFSLRGRVLAVLAVAVAGVLLVVLLALRVTGPVPWPVAFGVVGLVAGWAGVLSAAAPGNDSPGAVDNASGMIAALAAARALATHHDVGVLFTGAEEFGMEGARVWCRGASADGVFVNFDGLDGRGGYRVIRHPGCEREAARSLAAALGETGTPASVGPLPPGVMVDGAVLARHGLSGVTVSRGDWTTLGVVHTGRDVPERVHVPDLVEAGRAVARWVSERAR